MEENTLNKVKLNQEVKIKKIDASRQYEKKNFRFRNDRTRIKPVLRSPLGDPTAYEVRGSLISLREEEAKKIYIF